MTVLQELRKQKFKTVKAFAEAYGCSSSKASMILQGKYQLTLTREEVQHLATVLNISFEECVQACDASYAELRNYDTCPVEYRLESIWKRDDEIAERVKQAKQTGDWSYFKFDLEADRLSLQKVCEILNVYLDATPEQVTRAFRTKVKALADGKGGYNGDMDALTKAKEQALQYAQQQHGGR